MPIKIGRKEHIRRLNELGEMYFAPLSYFKRVEKNDFRGDKNEALWQMVQAHQAKIGIQLSDDDEVTWLDGASGELVGQVKLAINDVEKIGICSLSKGKVEEGRLLVNENMREFGTHMLVINRPDIFRERIISHIKANGIALESKHVEYVDESDHSGPMGIFRKFKAYEAQNEIRYAVYNRAAPFSMQIGSLEDISQIYEMSKLQVLTRE